MQKSYFSYVLRTWLTAIASCCTMSVCAQSEVTLETAGTLSSNLTECGKTLKISGPINGTDIKFLREKINNGPLTTLDLSEARIVKGGEAYDGSNQTENNVIGQGMFYECAKLRAIELPTTVTAIKSTAFASTGLVEVDIPNSVLSVGGDAFSYNDALTTVVIGAHVAQLGQGVFWSCNNLKTAYMKPMNPPAVPAYLFSTTPKVIVYSAALADYKTSDWKQYNLVGNLEETYPKEEDATDVINRLCSTYFEDDACTQLKADYQAMNDEALTASMKDAGLPDFMTAIALKVKNGTWAAYEQDFRIHSYKPYSDASYWNNKMMSTGGSYMGNPTGIYAENDGDELYVFVDGDVPADATLYAAGCVENQLITNAKTGQRLVKGLNIITGRKDALYYILYVADTKAMTKTLSEWPDIKIHIEGGKVNGYYDITRHSDTDYQALLKAATLPRFTLRGGHSLIHLKKTSFKTVFPTTVDKSIAWYDSIAVWQKDLMGYTEAVATGQRAGAPYYLTGGEAIYPLYYNNPIFAIEGESGDAGYANSSAYRVSYNSLDCIRNCLNALNPDMDEWCAGHENGHNNQGAINLEGGTESSNNLFSNYCRYLTGLVTSVGSPLSTVMDEFARNQPFYTRGVDSQLRMYWQLYLYYHLGQRKTDFYPTLFKLLREDPLSLWSTGGNLNSGMKFVKKVCEAAQEDITDFFTVYGFFVPMANVTIDDYGTRKLTVRATDIRRTKDVISKYPVKNQTMLYVEDRVDYVLTTGFLTKAGQKRRDSNKVGQCGDLGQFTSYWPDALQPSSYTYLQADSLYAMEGTGGVGFKMLDSENNLAYAANAFNYCIPTSVGNDFTIFSIDADGTLHETTKAGEGAADIYLSRAGKLQDSLYAKVIKATVSGNINASDFGYMRQLVNEGNLSSIVLTDATIKSGGYYSYNKEKLTGGQNLIGQHVFHDCKQLTSILLPQAKLTKIEANAFTQSGLKQIDIPDCVTALGEDAFAYCDVLSKVFIGTKMRTIAKGAFYSSNVKDVYVKATTPPAVNDYLFSSKPVIHVYASSLEAYKASRWAEYGTLKGDLDEYQDIVAVEAPETDMLRQQSLSTTPTYDLFGRRATTLKPGTIYLRGGKKFIVPARR